MPPMKIQPIDIDSQKLKEAVVVRNDVVKPILKLRLKRLFVFDRQFPSVLRNSSSSEKQVIAAAGEVPPSIKDSAAEGTAMEFEPSSVCLAKMAQSFIEDSSEKPAVAKCGRNRCNCFNGNNNSDSSDEELDLRKIVAESLASLGYEIQMGEYEYIDAIVEGERLIIDIDF